MWRRDGGCHPPQPPFHRLLIFGWNISFINASSCGIFFSFLLYRVNWKHVHTCARIASRLTHPHTWCFTFPSSYSLSSVVPLVLADGNTEILDKWQDIVCHRGSVSARPNIHFQRNVDLFSTGEEGKRLQLSLFSPFLCFIMATWNIGLALSHLRHCGGRVMFRGKAFFLVLGVTHFPSKNIFSPTTYCMTSTWRKTPFIKSFELCIWLSVRMSVTADHLMESSADFIVGCSHK